MGKTRLLFVFIILGLTLTYVLKHNINRSSYKHSIVRLTTKAEKYFQINKINEAIEFQLKAIDIADSNDFPDIGSLYLTLGGYYFQLNDLEKVVGYTKKGLKIIDNSSNQSKSEQDQQHLGYIQLSNSYRLLNNPDSALFFLNYLKNKLDIESEGHEDFSYFDLFSKILFWEALIHFEIGNFDKALALNFESTGLRKRYQAAKSYLSENYTLFGDIFTRKEDFEKAEIYYLKSASIIEEIYGNESLYYAEKLSSLGNLYYEAESYDKALNAFDNSYKIQKHLFQDNNNQLAYSYNNLGDIYCKLGDYSKGIKLYNKAKEAFISDNLFDELSVIYHNIGNAHQEQGNYKDAEFFYRTALKTASETRRDRNIYTSFTYKRMGDLFLKTGDYINAIDFYNKSIIELGCFEIDSCLRDLLAFSDNTFSLVDLYESYFYKGISELNYFKTKDEFKYLINSIKSFNAASTLSDVIRNQYTSEKAKRKINETTMFLNENYIQALIILKSKYNHDVDNAIIEIMERNKYTALRSSLHTTKWSYNENIPKYISRTIDSLQKRNRYIKSQQNFNKSSEEYFKINFQIDSIYNNLISKSQNFKKSLYAFNYHTIEEIQNKLNDTTGIITFSVFDTTLILVALNNKDYKIQFRKVNYSLYAQLERLLMSVKFSDTKSLISEGIQLNNVFIQPLQEIINSLSSIILIPDQKLFNIPFDLLISNNGIDSPGEIADQNYLLTKFNISYQYSMNLWVDNLIINKDQLESRWLYSFSGFAPFAFSDEEHIEDKYNKLRLPYSRIEVNNICNLYNEFNKNYRAFIGLESQESIIVNSFQDSQIVHIASHTFINENSTDFYIAIQNNIKESETVTPITEDLINSTFYSSTDGGLYLSEIFNLDISSELVTLSTCQSGYGNHYDGEGVISFTQGFYFSGAKNIIYTLWDVSDKHTMEFMSKYYYYLSKEWDYISALRQVKLDFIKSNYTLPKFWSGFQIIG